MKHIYQPDQVVMGNWTITKVIGEGSYGKVYEIVRSDFGTEYRAALKVMTIPASESEIKMALEEGMSIDGARQYFYTMVEEIVSEFALMSKLKGMTNIVSYEDHAVIPHENGIGWDILIRMELLTPLLTYAYQHPFSRRNIIQLGADMCRALELCQKYNIIHRDIKPENIFVSANGDFKLGDFGIARTIEKTSSGLSKKGTYNYMAPEVYRGEEYGFSVDTYSLGIVLYRLLNQNRVPFMPEAPTPITYAHREDALAKRMKGVAFTAPFYHQGRLPEIVLRACSFQPKDRYSTPQQMRKELESIQYTEAEAEIIYPSGDDLSIEENLYIATGKSQDAPLDIIEDDATAYIFGNRPVADATSGTVSLFGSPNKEPSILDKTGGTEYLFAPQKKESPKVAQPPSAHSKASTRKPWVIPMAITLAVMVVVGGGFAYYQHVQTENEQQELAIQESVIAQEQADITAYNDYMEQATSLMETAPEEAMSSLLQAQELQPENPDPFVNYAYALYLSRDYDTCIDYIENELALGKAYDITYQSMLAEVLGSAYFEQQDYAAAASFFRLSTAGGDLTVSAMRDYAVSLGRLGDIDAADEVLETMFDAGATQIETTYVQAEVDYAKEDYLAAEAGFQTVMSDSDDTALQIRAMRSLAEVYRDCAVLERLGQSPIANAAMLEAELLTEGISIYGLRYDASLWEMQAMACFETYNVTPGLDDSWLTRAANAFNLVIELGIQKEYLYTNLYTIYYQLGDYTQAEEALVAYEAVYPYAYTPHALRATMWIMLENQKSQDNRDYSDAYAEFLVAESMLYSGDDTTYYQQVKSLVDTLFSQGWL